jgi:hydroxyacylglutathione hydrolase
MTIHIQAILAFRDNYIWLISDSATRQALVVDPGDARPVLTTLQTEQLNLAGILVTHHHSDHSGGIRQLVEQYPKIPVFGPKNESIAGITVPVQEGNIVTVAGISMQFQVLDLPGHTRGHVGFYSPGVLFCGDVLFSVGCGRLFEGTPAQMWTSLSKISSLPEETLMYCAHEYTLDNIAFAKWVEPHNTALLQREQEAHLLQDQDLPTVPSQLAVEKQTNPFLRSEVATVIHAAEHFAGRTLTSATEVFATIRHWKDTQFD